jgi:hypothetical protein
VPAPSPAFVTVSVYVVVAETGVEVTAKFAVHVAAAVMDTLVVDDVPLQLPDHPANVEPDWGAAVSVTTVPSA